MVPRRSKEEAVAAVEHHFWADVRRREEELRNELRPHGVAVVMVWDRDDVQTIAKREEQEKRRMKAAKAERVHQAALDTLLSFARSEVAMKITGRKRRWPNALKKAVHTFRHTAWTQVPFPSLRKSGLEYSQETRLTSTRPATMENSSDATDSEWRLLNADLLSAPAILSVDEADNTVIHVARAAQRRFGNHSVAVVSQDGDFLVREPVGTYRWVVSLRFGLKDRWALLDRQKVETLSDMFVDTDVLRMTGCMCGQDYTGVGLKGISWKTVLKEPLVVKVSEVFIARVVDADMLVGDSGSYQDSFG